MTPGTYLRLRRQAAGLSIEDVAAMVRTSPRLGEVDVIAWLRRVEEDVAALSPDVIGALGVAFRFSCPVLWQLIDLRSYGPDTIQVPPICLTCGCTDEDSCVDPVTRAPCAWHSEDLCTACIGHPSTERHPA